MCFMWSVYSYFLLVDPCSLILHSFPLSHFCYTVLSPISRLQFVFSSPTPSVKVCFNFSSHMITFLVSWFLPLFSPTWIHTPNNYELGSTHENRECSSAWGWIISLPSMFSSSIYFPADFILFIKRIGFHC